MNDKRSELVGVLMQQYTVLRNETTLLITHQQAHVRYFHIVATAIIALFALIVPNANLAHLLANTTFLIILMYLITTVVGYLAFTLLQTFYSMNVLGAYLSVIEKKINKLLGTKAATWESVLSPKFNSLPKGRNKIFFPGTYLFVSQAIIALCTMIGVPSFFVVMFWNDATVTGIGWLLVGLNIFYSLGILGFILLVSTDVLAKNRLWTRAYVLASRTSRPNEKLED